MSAHRSKVLHDVHGYVALACWLTIIIFTAIGAFLVGYWLGVRA